MACKVAIPSRLCWGVDEMFRVLIIALSTSFHDDGNELYAADTERPIDTSKSDIDVGFLFRCSLSFL